MYLCEHILVFLKPPTSIIQPNVQKQILCVLFSFRNEIYIFVLPTAQRHGQDLLANTSEHFFKKNCFKMGMGLFTYVFLTMQEMDGRIYGKLY